MNNTNDKARQLIEELYNKHYRNMMAMINKDTICTSMAEDIIQETFTEAMNHAEKLLIHENPGGWLMETAKWKMLSVKRNFLKYNTREVAELDVDISGMQADYGLVELSFLMDQILTLHEKTLFHLYYNGGYSAKELAEAEHITEGTFKVRMLRLRKKLQKQLHAENGKKSKKK